MNLNAESLMATEQIQPTTANLIQLDSLQLYEELFANYARLSNTSTNINGSLIKLTVNEHGANCFAGSQELGAAITMVLYGIVCLVGLFGNTLVIYVVLCYSKMQTVTNMYILNLAVADECFLIGIPFLLFTMHKGSWHFGEYACKAYMVSTSITQFTSSIFLLIMSADRYMAVCHPITSPRYRTLCVAKLVCMGAWLTSALLMLPVILFASTIQMGEHTSCNIKWPEGHGTHSAAGFIVYTLVLGFATPLSFILVFYCLVMRKLHTVGLKHKSKDKRRSHRRVTRLVLIVITVYVLCWLPYWVAQLTLIFSTPAVGSESACMSRLELFTFLLVGCLGYSNSAINPLLYAFLSENFKKSFLKAFSCRANNGKELNLPTRTEHQLLPHWCKRNRQHQRDNCAAAISFCPAQQQQAMTGQSQVTNTYPVTGTSAVYGTGQTITTSLMENYTELTVTASSKKSRKQAASVLDELTSSTGLLPERQCVGRRMSVLQTDF